MTTDLFFKEVNIYIFPLMFFYSLYFKTISNDYLGKLLILKVSEWVM